MIMKIIRWIRGYVVFTAVGRFPERFINLLNYRGIRYWDLSPLKNGYKATMYLKDYKNVGKIAKKSRVKLRNNRGEGLPFFTNKYKKRKGILIGAICAILIMSVLSHFIWVIDINSNVRLSDAEVLTELKNSGLEIGTLKDTMDVDEVERKTLLSCSKIGWMSINALNNVATVELKEKAQVPKKSNSDTPSNLKASCDGVITKATVQNGVCVVKKGSAVAENQLLVSAVTEGKEGEISYVHAKGEIMADVNETNTFKINLNKGLIISENYTEKSNFTFLCFNIPFGLSSSESGEKASVFHTYRLNINGVNLPLGKAVQRIYYYTNSEEKLDEETAKNILLKKIALWECFNYKNATIKSKNVSFSKKGEKLNAKVSYVVNKNIAVSQKISVLS